MNWEAIAERAQGLRTRGTDLQKRLRGLRRRLTLLLAVIGPGIITSNVDNDAGGISVYTQAGAQYGYALLWSLIPMTIALYVTEEMCARMGVVTGKGLSDLILGVGDSGNLPPGGGDFSLRLRSVSVLRIFRIFGKAGLADRRETHGDSKSSHGFRLPAHVDRTRRNHDCPVAVFLSSGQFRGKESGAASISAGTR